MKLEFAAIAFVGLCVLAGCGKDAKPLVDAAEKYEKDTCACKDMACTAKTFADYMEAVKKLTDEKLVPSEDQAKKITDASENVAKCITEMTAKMTKDAAGGAMKKAADK